MRLPLAILLALLLATSAGAQISRGGDYAYYWRTTNGLTLGTNYTISVWVKPDKAAMDEQTYGGWIANERSTSALFGAGYDWELTYSANNSWIWESVAGTNRAYIIAPTKYVLPKWTHLAAVCDGTGQKLRLYVDGVLIGSTNIVGTPNDSSANLTVGNAGWTIPQAVLQFEGITQDLRAYSRVLTANEIYTLATMPWMLADDPTMVLRTDITELDTGINLQNSRVRNFGTANLGVCDYVNAQLAAPAGPLKTAPKAFEIPEKIP